MCRLRDALRSPCLNLVGLDAAVVGLALRIGADIIEDTGERLLQAVDSVGADLIRAPQER